MTDRLASLKSRQLLRELQIEQRALELARKRDARRRLEIGATILDAGFGEWHALEIVGVLLDARERIEGSPTQRLAVRLRAEGHLRGRRKRPDSDAVHSDATAAAHDGIGLIAAMFEAKPEPEGNSS